MESITKYNNLSLAEKKATGEITEFLKFAMSGEIKEDEIEIIYPPESRMGDYSVPCFKLSSALKMPPAKVSSNLSARVKNFEYFSKVQAAGPYLNFYVNEKFIAEVLKEISRRKAKYGLAKKEKEKIMVEYASLNTHKEFHIGHLRNVCLGSSIVNILKFQGKSVIPAYYINDFAWHVGQTIWGYLKFGFKEEPAENKGKFLGQLYARSAKMVAENDQYKEEAKSVMKKLQQGDKEITKLWKKTRQWSINEFEEIFKELGAEFKARFFESQFFHTGIEMVQNLKIRGILKESQGAVIADLQNYDLGVLVFLRQDGTTLYPVSDIPLAFSKFKKYKIDKSLYIVDVRQSFYFKQLFKILELIGLNNPLQHIDYEFVTLPEGAMASRLGRVVLMQDLKDEVYKRALEETKKRHSDWKEKKLQMTAKKITLAAIKFGMLKSGKEKVIVFDVNQSLEFTGFTGPYLQYVGARINSIIKKSKFQNSNIKQNQKHKIQRKNLFDTHEEKSIIKLLAAFPQVMESAAKNYEPALVSQYLYNLASSFSTFYEKVSVLKAEPDLKRARLFLIRQVRTVMENGLKVLGIEMLDEM
ncbi:arginine--tRNA ligase [Candidatus Parcubacteria bacterium]|nr:MAG: arginine--tRNA ligase [Candidatus Parcubacteria bacterium]